MGVSIIRTTPQSAPPPPPAPAVPVVNDDQPIRFQVLNPSPGVSNPPPQISDPPPSSGLMSAYETYQKISSHPLMKGMVRLVESPSFRDNAMKVMTHPGRMNILYCEIGWFLFFLIFRAYLKSRVEGFLKKLLIGFFCFLIFWIGASSIPILVIGRPYLEIYKSIFNAFFG